MEDIWSAGSEVTAAFLSVQAAQLCNVNLSLNINPNFSRLLETSLVSLNITTKTELVLRLAGMSTGCGRQTDSLVGRSAVGLYPEWDRRARPLI